jgi:hypothetical protein
MTGSAQDTTPEIRAGSIYKDVYEKRIGDRWTSSRRDHPEAELEVAAIEHGALAFAGPEAMRRGLSDGVFLLRIPRNIDVRAGDEFAAGFYQGPDHEPHGRFRDIRAEDLGDPLLGFHQRVNQIEQFLLERRFWARTFPSDVARLGEALTALSRQVLESVTAYVGIPEHERRRATGGCSEALGSYHLTFNHYRPALREIGLNSHKDDGLVTILRTTQPGLQVSREDGWENVPVDPDYFVVNFGLSMQILTAQSGNPVSAIMHRVAHQDDHRSSFGHFSSSRCEPGNDDGVYRYVAGAGLQLVCASRDLIESNDREIYEGTESPEPGPR